MAVERRRVPRLSGRPLRRTPDLDTAEAKAALKDTSEAAAGAVAYAAYHPHCSFQVFLDYVNFGMSYDPGADAPEESVTPGEWIEALCLTVLRDKAKWHSEAFHSARHKFAEQAQGTPTGELDTGLMTVVLDDTGDDKEYPPSARAKLAAVDAALDRIRTRAAETGEPLMDRPDSAAGSGLCAGGRPCSSAEMGGSPPLARRALHGKPYWWTTEDQRFTLRPADWLLTVPPEPPPAPVLADLVQWRAARPS